MRSVLVGLILLSPVICSASAYAEEKAAPPDNVKTANPNDVGKIVINPADRVITLITTETLKKGQWAFTDIDVAMLMMSVGLTDTVQLSALFSAAYPFALGGEVNVKWRFLDTNHFKMAASAIGFGGIGWNGNGAGAGGVLAMDACVDERCRYAFTTTANLAYAYSSISTSLNYQSRPPKKGHNFLLYSGVGARLRPFDLVSFLIEFTYGGVWRSDAQENAIVVSAGARFHIKDRWLVDVSLMYPMDVKASDVTGCAFPLPLVSFSYSW